MRQVLRLKFSLLVIGLLAGLSVAVPASGSQPSDFATVVPGFAVLETRVGVAATPVGLSVGSQRTVSEDEVGQMCPRFDGMVLGSCVATKAGAPGGQKVALGLSEGMDDLRLVKVR